MGFPNRSPSRPAGYQELRPHYAKLPLAARLYARARWTVCPLARVESFVPRSGTVLDLGSGLGIFAHLLALRAPRRRVLGLERNPLRVSQAWRLAQGVPNLEFRCADLRSTSLPPARAITVVDVLHHIPAPHQQSELVRLCFRSLEPGGLLLVKEIAEAPRWKYAWNYLHDRLLSGGGLCYRSRRAMVELLTGAGFLVRVLPLPAQAPYPHVLYMAVRP